MDKQSSLFQKVQKKYEMHKKIGISTIVLAAVVGILTVIFVFVEVLGNSAPVWNQFHYWGAGIFLILLVVGIILVVFAHRALRDIERAVDRLNPDERECAIREKAMAKALKIFVFVISPILFIPVSVLLLLEIINFVTWILFVAQYLALIITWAVVRTIEYKNF